MGARKNTPPPPGPTCPDCQRLAAELGRLQRQQRKQATQLRNMEALIRTQAAELTEALELSRRLNDALSYHRFTQPYLLHLFGQHLPQGNTLAAGLIHFN